MSFEFSVLRGGWGWGGGGEEGSVREDREDRG